MSRGLSESGQATALVLVGVMVLAIPAGLALAQGLTASSTATDTATVVTPTLPPVNLTETPTPTPQGDNNDTGDNTTTGQTHFVNAGGGIADGVTSEEGCSDAAYDTIQAAVDAAEPGGTVAVCAGTYREHVEVTTPNLTITAADRLTQAVGDVTITNANESAVWINASGVTLQGFNISVGEGADYAIEVGGKEAVIRDNTVKSGGVGIFLGDGHPETGKCKVNNDSGKKTCDYNPRVNPTLGTATKGRVLNNTVSADSIRIWVDADRTVVQNNVVTGRITADDAARRAENQRRHTFDPKRFNNSIISSGNHTVVRGNSVEQTQGGKIRYSEAGILVGKTPRQGHNIATNNTVANNSVVKPDGHGIKARRNVSAGVVVRDNFVTETTIGIWVRSGGVIRNNTVRPSDADTLYDEAIVGSGVMGEDVLVINNNASGYILNLHVGPACNPVAFCRNGGNVTVTGNTLRNPAVKGMKIDSCGNPNASVSVENNKISGSPDHGIDIYPIWNNRCPDRTRQIKILNNQITSNRQGINIGEFSAIDNMEIHGNLINNNQHIGIFNRNDSRIVDATNNIWACGGPSSGFDPLADPYTGRLANGTGDAITAGNGSTHNGHPVSNVHFDPFKVQHSSTCLESQPTPTSTPTPTPTPTPTATPTGTATPTTTPTPTPAAGSGNETGVTDGNGTGGEGSGGETSGGVGSSGETATPPMTPTATETPPETPTPTPVVEPGFGVVTWAVSVALLVSLVALRRRAATNREERYD